MRKQNTAHFMELEQFYQLISNYWKCFSFLNFNALARYSITRGKKFLIRYLNGVRKIRSMKR